MLKSTIYNPSTDAYIKNTPQNRARVDEAVRRVFEYVNADYANTKEARKKREARRQNKVQPSFNVGNYFRRLENFEETDTNMIRNSKRKSKPYKFIFEVTFYKIADEGVITKNSIVRDNVRYSPLNSGYYASRKNVIQKAYMIGNKSFDKMISALDNDSLNTMVMNIASQVEFALVSNKQAVEDVDFDIMDEVLYDNENECISTNANLFNIHTEGDRLVSSYMDMTTKLNKGCWFSLLMSAFEKQYNKKYKKAPLSIELIKNICNVNREGLGMTTNEALLFFKKYQVKLVIYNQMMKKMFEFTPEKATNFSTKCIHAIMSNKHIYYINDEKAIKSLCQKDITDTFLPPSRNYAIPKKDKSKVVYCKEVEQILTEIINANESVLIGTNVSLFNVCKYLIGFGLIPQINGSDNLKSVSIIKKGGEDKNISIVIQSIYNLVISDTEKQNMDLNSYIKANDIKKQVEKSIFTYPLLSQYSSSLLKAFENYSRPPLVCNFAENINGKYYGIDKSKCYSSILNKMQTIDVFSVFDEFEKYKGETITEYSWYLVKRVDESTVPSLAHIIFSEQICLVSGHTLLGYLKYYGMDTIKILEFITPHLQYMNPLCNFIKKTFKDESNADIQSYLKNIFNTTIGKFGTLRKKNTKMCLTTDKATCLNLCRTYGTLGVDTFCIKICDDNKIDFEYDDDLIVDEREHAVEEEEEEEQNDDDNALYVFKQESKETQLINGYNSINLSILDTNRLELFLTAMKIQDLGGKIVSIKTDCIFIDNDENTDKVIDYYSKLPKKWDGYKIEHKEIRTTKMITDKYKKEYTRLHEKERNKVIRFEDEWNIKPSDIPDDTLIYGLAGTGKSYVQKMRCNKDTLYITPCNTLAVNIKKELKENNRENCTATTFAKLTGSIDGEYKREITKFNITSYKYIVIEEIYTYNVSDLTILKAFKEAHKDIVFFANGGGEQLENVQVKTEEEIEYIDRCIKKLFKNIIELVHNKRLNGAELEKNNAVISDIFVNKLKPVDIIHKHFSDRVISFEDNTCRKNICYTNDTVHLVNLKMNQKFNNTYDFKVGDAIIYKGFKTLIMENGFTLYKNNSYMITSMDNEHVVLTEILDGLECTYEVKNLKANFDFSWGVTCHSIQGLTYREPICVFEANEYYVNKRWFYVCISRVTSFKDLYFCLDKMNSGQFKNLNYKIQSYIKTDNEKGFVLPDGFKYVDAEWVKTAFKNQKGSCFHCGCGMRKNWTDERDNEQYSVDRLDNAQGHWFSTKHSNIVLSCWKCNYTRK